MSLLALPQHGLQLHMSAQWFAQVLDPGSEPGYTASALIHCAISSAPHHRPPFSWVYNILWPSWELWLEGGTVFSGDLRDSDMTSAWP